MEVESTKVVVKYPKVESKKIEEKAPFMTAMAANTIREIVNLANEKQIEKEDIVSLLKENGQFVLIYYTHL